jgi:endonuclease III
VLFLLITRGEKSMSNVYDVDSVWSMAHQAVKDRSSKEILDWFTNVPHPSEITDSDFLSELAWCIYNAGMKETVVRSKWEDIKSVFSYFDPDSIIATENEIPDMIRRVFNHQAKASAVIQGAKKIKADGPMKDKFKGMAEQRAIVYLESFPFIGKVTRYHLARNIGFDVVKPDRHLVRLAEAFETTPDDLVDRIAESTGLRRGFIDFVLWQWMAWDGAKIIRNAREYD